MLNSSTLAMAASLFTIWAIAVLVVLRFFQWRDAMKSAEPTMIQNSTEGSA